MTIRSAGRGTRWIGHRVEPMAQLHIEVLEVAEVAAEEEILADVAERTLDLALGFRPVGAARLGLEAEVPGEVEQATIVDDQAIEILPEHGGFHAVVENFPGRAAESLKRGGMAAQHGSEVLMQDEAGPDQPRVAEHQRK